MFPNRYLPGVFAGLLTIAACTSTRPPEGVTQPSPPPTIRHSAFVDTTGPWAIHVVSVDLKDRRNTLTSARAFRGVPGRETTSSMASRLRSPGRQPAVAVNADFYTGGGHTLSAQVMGAEIVQTEQGRPSDSWSSRFKEQFGVTRGGRVLMERVQFAGLAIVEHGGRYRIGGVNAAPSERRSIEIRTEHAAPDSGSNGTSLRSVAARRVGMSGDTALAVLAGAVTGNATRPGRNELWFQWNPDSLVIPESDLDPGDTVRLVLGFPGHRDPPEMLIGGLPRVVIDGRLNPALSIEAQGPPADFARKRHPRTGVGVSRDSTTLFLVTVDGRQAGSVGMTLEEFGRLMISVGIHQGLNLDGGGSTTMVVDGAVVNSPSDLTGERPVANCLVVLRKDGTE